MVPSENQPRSWCSDLDSSSSFHDVSRVRGLTDGCLKSATVPEPQSCSLSLCLLSVQHSSCWGWKSPQQAHQVSTQSQVRELGSVNTGFQRSQKLFFGSSSKARKLQARESWLRSKQQARLSRAPFILSVMISNWPAQTHAHLADKSWLCMHELSDLTRVH